MGRIRSIIQPRAQVDLKDPALWSGWGGLGLTSAGRLTTAGERVTPEKALTLPVYLACIKNKSEDIAAQPWHVYRPNPSGRGRVKAEGDAVYRILHEEFNPEMSSFTGVELLMSWARGWGLGLAEIERVNGEPVALWPIHPSRIWVKRVDGAMTYFVRNEEDPMRPIPLPMSDVFCVHGLGSDGYVGYSLAAMISETIGVGLAAQTYGAAMFGNDTTLGVVFTTQDEMSEIAYNRMKESLRESRAGAKHAFAPFIAEGAKVERMGIPPKDAQMIETGHWTADQVARVDRMPLHMIGEREPFASIEQLGIEYAKFSLKPWVVRLEREAQRKLLAGRKGWTNEINLNGLMRGDYAGRTNGYRTMISTGAMTPNEARALEGEELSEDEGADKLWMQGAMQPLEKLAAMPEPEPEPEPDEDEGDGEEDEAPDDNAEGDADDADDGPIPPTPEDQVESLRPVFLDAASRLTRRETMAVRRAATKHGDDVPAFQRWARTHYEGMRTLLVEAFGPVCESGGADPGRWLLEEAHDAAMDAGRRTLQAYGGGHELPPDDVRATALAERMMARAVRELGESQ